MVRYLFLFAVMMGAARASGSGNNPWQMPPRGGSLFGKLEYFGKKLAGTASDLDAQSEVLEKSIKEDLNTAAKESKKKTEQLKKDAKNAVKTTKTEAKKVAEKAKAQTQNAKREADKAAAKTKKITKEAKADALQAADKLKKTSKEIEESVKGSWFSLSTTR
mmetsp:Transcript_23065/g.41633  ORF Transcript_23065/g.41633 Transcript_23065/m.41633 type:complete len:162 (-) Transcript_23065:233-718(-)